MPMKRLLNESRAFDPKAIAILMEAFDCVVVELNLQTITEREKAAKIIIGLALGQTVLDAAKLREIALARMRIETCWQRPL
ncbi:MAG TPA: hypothetical protein VGF57_08045 [Roseiarcus sp.]